MHRGTQRWKMLEVAQAVILGLLLLTLDCVNVDLLPSLPSTQQVEVEHVLRDLLLCQLHPVTMFMHWFMVFFSVLCLLCFLIIRTGVA